MNQSNFRNILSNWIHFSAPTTFPIWCMKQPQNNMQDFHEIWHWEILLRCGNTSRFFVCNNTHILKQWEKTIVSDSVFASNSSTYIHSQPTLSETFWILSLDSAKTLLSSISSTSTKIHSKWIASISFSYLSTVFPR